MRIIIPAAYRLTTAIEPMKTILAVVPVIYFMVNEVSGQNRSYFGMEASITNDVFEITETGDDLKTGPQTGGLWGFNLRQDITSYFFIETGLIRKYYASGIGFKRPIDISFSGTSIDAWLIPLRLGTRVNLYKEKLYFVPVLGYSFCINTYYGYGSYGPSSGSAKTIDHSVSFSYTENTDLVKYFSLIQTGLGFEFILFKTVVLSVSTNYYTGFTKVIELNDITYTVDDSDSFTGESFSKGEFWSIGVGLKYPISNFWTKKVKSKGEL